MKRLDKIQIRPGKEKFEFRLWLDGQRQPVEFETLPRQAASIAEVIRDFLAELKIPIADGPSNPFCFVEVPAPRGTPQPPEEKPASATLTFRVVKPDA
jgi:hypothetical protein